MNHVTKPLTEKWKIAGAARSSPRDAPFILLAAMVLVPLLVTPFARAQTVVATVNVGIAPFGLAYDSAKGEVFVANFGSNTVSVISDGTSPSTTSTTTTTGIATTTGTTTTTSSATTLTTTSVSTTTTTQTSTTTVTATLTQTSTTTATSTVTTQTTTTATVTSPTTTTETTTQTVTSTTTSPTITTTTVTTPTTTTVTSTVTTTRTLTTTATVATSLVPSLTLIKCDPSNVDLGGKTTCTATVKTADGAKPTRSFAFSNSGTGTFGDPECGTGDRPSGDVSLKCQVEYTPGETGEQTIIAVYPGDTRHSGSSGTFSLKVVANGEGGEEDASSASSGSAANPLNLSMAPLFASGTVLTVAASFFFSRLRARGGQRF